MYVDDIIMLCYYIEDVLKPRLFGLIRLIELDSDIGCLFFNHLTKHINMISLSNILFSH